MSKQQVLNWCHNNLEEFTSHDQINDVDFMFGCWDKTGCTKELAVECVDEVIRIYEVK